MNKNTDSVSLESPGVSPQPDLLKRLCELAPKEWDVDTSQNPYVAYLCFAQDDVSESERWRERYRAIVCLKVDDDDYKHRTPDQISSDAIVFLWDWLDREMGPCSVFRQGGPAFPAPKFSFDGGCNWGETRIEALVKTCIQHLEENAEVTP